MILKLIFITLTSHIYRIFKQTLKSGGGNLTQKHVSLAVLFLMEACQKVDKMFGLTPQSTTHTIRDVMKDVDKLTAHLTEHNVARGTDEHQCSKIQQRVGGRN